MADELDELFGAEGGQPRPRTGLVYSLLGVGLVLTLLGMACSAAPGGLIVVVAWAVVEKESDRVASGYLPSDTAQEVRQARQAVLLGLLAVLAAFVVQGVLLCSGYYASLWEAMLRLAVELFADAADLPVAP